MPKEYVMIQTETGPVVWTLGRLKEVFRHDSNVSLRFVGGQVKTFPLPSSGKAGAFEALLATISRVDELVRIKDGRFGSRAAMACMYTDGGHVVIGYGDDQPTRVLGGDEDLKGVLKAWQGTPALLELASLTAPPAAPKPKPAPVLPPKIDRSAFSAMDRLRFAEDEAHKRTVVAAPLKISEAEASDRITLVCRVSGVREPIVDLSQSCRGQFIGKDGHPLNEQVGAQLEDLKAKVENFRIAAFNLDDLRGLWSAGQQVAAAVSALPDVSDYFRATKPKIIALCNSLPDPPADEVSPGKGAAAVDRAARVGTAAASA